MFKIGDFSRLGQVSVRMLRHYDKLGLLKPNQIDTFTGYRYYTVDQLARLNRIVALNGLGLTLQQITALIDRRDGLSVAQLRGMLTLRQAELEQELAEKHFQLAGVAARLRQIELEGQESPYEIVIKSVEALPIVGLRQTVPTMQQMGYYCRSMYEQLYTHLSWYAIDPLPHELTLYHNAEYTETNLHVETAAQIDPDLIDEHPADDLLVFYRLPAVAQVAALIYTGAYAEVGQGFLALLEWIGTHNQLVAGPARELHLSGPAHIKGVLQEPAILELQVPIQPLRY